MAAYWERLFDCSWQRGSCDASADVTSRPGFVFNSDVTVVHDVVWTLVHGLQRYLPSIGDDLSRFSTSDYLDALKRVHFDGLSGLVRFDASSDNLVDCVVLQGVNASSGYDVVEVGKWSSVDATLTLNQSTLRWATARAPESVCSRACERGHIRSFRTPNCCWDCVQCPLNAVVSPNESKCNSCPAYSWPSYSSANASATCEPIVPSFIEARGVFGSVLLTICAVGIGLCLATTVVFIRHNDHVLIKSSCREASYIILFGVSADFCCVAALFIGEPTDSKCFSLRFAFHLTCTLIYAPTLIKIVKIFRIFVSGTKSTYPPKFVGPRAQVVIIVAVVLGETLILLASTAVRAPLAAKSTPLDHAPIVELFCDEKLDSLATGLTFNLALVVACSLLAFKTRKLPQNFNESTQIAFCVNTTLLLWIVFVPTYIYATRAFLKTLLLSLAMLMNGMVSLLSLFALKVYAVCFLPAQGRDVARTNLNVTVTPSRHTPTRRWTPSQPALAYQAAAPTTH